MAQRQNAIIFKGNKINVNNKGFGADLTVQRLLTLDALLRRVRADVVAAARSRNTLPHSVLWCTTCCLIQVQ